MAAAALPVLTLGLLYAAGNQTSCEGHCPARPTGPDGSLVNDQFSFLHRDLGENGSKVRKTSITGTITYPPPHHDKIVPGLVPVGVAILKGTGISVLEVSAFAGVRVVVGSAGVLALAAVLAFALGALFRRAWLATLVAVLAIAVPYVVTSLPLLADGPAQWLLRVTPAAGFAAQQTLVEHAQVVAHYAPSAGYFPLPWWAGIAVLGAYTAVLLGLALKRLPHDDERTGRPVGGGDRRTTRQRTNRGGSVTARRP